MTSKYEQLLEEAKSLNISYENITFPMYHQEGKVFKFENGKSLEMHQLGAGYLSERVRSTSYSKFTSLYEDEDFSEIQRIVNDAKNLVGKEYVAAMFDNQIVGIMSNYNPVSHVSLIEAIKNAGFADSISHWVSTITHLDIYLVARSKSNSGLLVYLKIRNGHSGHYALSYRLVLSADGYEFENPAKNFARRRHLSQVGEVVNSLKEAMEQASVVKIDDELKSMKIDETVDWLRNNINFTVRQENVLDGALADKPANALELIIILGQYSSTSGYMSAVSGLVDPILKKVTK